MTAKSVLVGMVLFIWLGACVGKAEEINLARVTPSSPIVAGARNACVVGYIVGDEGLYLNSSAVEYDGASVALLPQRPSDALTMAKYSGKRVRLCGRMVADKACFQGDYVCAPHSKPLRLLRLRSIKLN